MLEPQRSSFDPDVESRPNEACWRITHGTARLPDYPRPICDPRIGGKLHRATRKPLGTGMTRCSRHSAEKCHTIDTFLANRASSKRASTGKVYFSNHFINGKSIPVPVNAYFRILCITHQAWRTRNERPMQPTGKQQAMPLIQPI